MKIKNYLLSIFEDGFKLKEKRILNFATDKKPSKVIETAKSQESKEKQDFNRAAILDAAAQQAFENPLDQSLFKGEMTKEKYSKAINQDLSQTTKAQLDKLFSYLENRDLEKSSLLNALKTTPLNINQAISIEQNLKDDGELRVFIAENQSAQSIDYLVLLMQKNGRDTALNGLMQEIQARVLTNLAPNTLDLLIKNSDIKNLSIDQKANLLFSSIEKDTKEKIINNILETTEENAQTAENPDSTKKIRLYIKHYSDISFDNDKHLDNEGQLKFPMIYASVLMSKIGLHRIKKGLDTQNYGISTATQYQLKENNSNIKFEDGSFKFEIAGAERSIKASPEAVQKVLAANTEAEIKEAVYTDLMSYVDSLSEKQKEKYDKKINNYKNSNKEMQDFLDSYKKDPIRAINQRQAIDINAEIALQTQESKEQNLQSYLSNEIAEGLISEPANPKSTNIEERRLALIQRENREALKLASKGEFKYIEMKAPISSMSKDEFEANFENFTGSQALENILSQRLNIPAVMTSKLIANAIHETFGANEFSLKEIYDEIINVDESDDRDLDEFLEDVRKKKNPSDIAKFDTAMKIQRILEEMQYKKSPKIEKGKDLLSLNNKQKEIFKNLKEITAFSSEEISNWDAFIAYISGTERAKDIRLNTIDGQSVYLNEGILQRHNSPDSALKIITTKEGNYEIDENGKFILNEKAIIKDINDYIKKGFLQESINKGENPKKLNNSQKLKELEITNLSNLTDKQKRLFQLGFILSEEGKFYKESKEANDTIDEFLNTYPAQEADILRQLLAQGADFNIIKNVPKNFLIGGGILVEKIDNNYTINGAAAISIPLSEGFSLQIGIAGGDSGIDAGANLSATLIDNKSIKAQANIGLSFSGLKAGFAASSKGETVRAKTSAGLMTAFNLVPIGAYGTLGLEFVENSAIQENVDKKQKQSSFNKTWQSFENAKSISEKINVLEKENANEKVKATISQLREQGLSDTEIVAAIELSKEALLKNALEESSAPLGAISEIGVAGVVLANVPVPFPIIYVNVTIGNQTVYIPKLEDTKKTLTKDQLRYIGQEKEILDQIQKLKATTDKTVYEDKAINAFYSNSGEIMIVEEESQGTLEAFNENLGIENKLNHYNETLKPLNLKLIAHPLNKIELKVNATEFKDTQIFLDPLMQDLGIIKDGQRLFLEGNLEDLVITREHITRPFKPDDSSSEILDIITIRKKNSVGIRTKDFLYKMIDGKNLHKDENGGWSIRQIGAYGTQNNIIDYKGYGKTNDKATERKIQESSLAQQEIQRLSEKENQRYEIDQSKMATETDRQVYDLIQERKAFSNEYITNQDLQDIIAINTERKRILERENAIGENIMTEIIDEFFKDKDFMKKFIDNVNNEKELIQLFKDELVSNSQSNNYDFKELNSNERNQVILGLLDKHFSLLRRNPRTIKDTLEARMEEVFKPVLSQDFENALDRLYPGATDNKTKAEKFADQILKDTYNPLIKDAKNAKSWEHISLKANESFYSITRRGKGDAKEYLATQLITVNETSAKNQTLIAKSINEYGVDSEIGKALNEMMNPLDTSTDKAFLNSEFTRKVLSLDYIYYIDEEGITLEDQKTINDLLTSTRKSFTDNQKATLEKFKNLVTRLKEAQRNGETIKLKGINNSTLEISFDTSITAGAYGKCGNMTLQSHEGITIKAYNKKGEIIGSKSEKTEIVGHSLQKRKTDIGLFTGISIKDSPSIKTKDPERGIKENPGNNQNKNPNAGDSHMETSSYGDQTVINNPTGTSGFSPSGGA